MQYPPGMGDAIGRALVVGMISFLVASVLAIWKIIEIAIWVFSHLQWVP